MRHRTKLTITIFVAATALAALINTASARSISLSNQNFRVAWSSLEYPGPTTVRCAVTLEGSFHTRTIAKSFGSLVGYITRAIKRRPCTNGTAWFHSGEANEALGGTFTNRLPWHIAYAGFAGTLPNISSILFFIEMLLTIRAPFFGIPVLCEYRNNSINGRATGTASREAGGALTNLAMSGAIRSNTGGCPEIRYASRTGDGVVTLLGTTTRITVTLI